jgi:hypothetical protein
MPPAQAGEIIARAVERRAPRAAVGRDAKVTALIERLAPVSYWKIPALPAPRRTIRASSLAFRCGMNARASRTTAPRLS